MDSTETSIYISDQYNNRIQKWVIGATNGTTVAGQTTGASGVGPTFLNAPTDILLDSNNNLYVSDYNNNRVQLWYYGASSGITVAGTGKDNDFALEFIYTLGIFEIYNFWLFLNDIFNYINRYGR